jgi:hypothetical protein
MFEARVKLTPVGAAAVPHSPAVENAATFWGKISSSSQSKTMSMDPLRNEARLRKEFPKKLENYLRERTNVDELRPKLTERETSSIDIDKEVLFSLSKIVIRVRRVEYGSIDLFLEIFGLNGESGRQFLLVALAQYAQPAFNEAMGTAVQFVSDVDVNEMEGDMPDAEAGSRTKTVKDGVNALWILANTSMLIPLGLASYVCYVCYTTLMTEFHDLREERKVLLNNHADIQSAMSTRNKDLIEQNKDLIEQNKALSATLVTHATGSVANTKAIQDLVVNLSTKAAADGKDAGKQRATDRNDAPPPATTNYNVCMLDADAPKTYSDARFRTARLKRTVMDSMFGTCPAAQR